MEASGGGRTFSRCGLIGGRSLGVARDGDTGTPASSLSALSFLPSRRRAALSCHHAPHHGALPLQRLEVMGLSDLNGKIWKCSSLEADLRHFVTMIEAGDDGKQWILSLPAPVGMI